MKIRFTRTIGLDIEKTRLQEVWSKTFNRWDEINVAAIYEGHQYATIKLSDSDFLLNVPTDSFVKLQEKKPELDYWEEKLAKR